MTKRKIRVFFKTYIYEIIALSVNLLIAITARMYFANTLMFYFSLVFILTLSFAFLLYFKTRDKGFYYLPLDKPGEGKNWVGKGKWEYVRTENCFVVTDSYVGHIFPRTILWDDYSFEFDFKIVNKTCGWIVRAVNLSNYIMLQCALGGINPHIRLDGQLPGGLGQEWTRWEHHEGDVGLSFKKNLEQDKWYRAVITCDKRSIKTVIFDEKGKIFDRHWIIPDVFVVPYETTEGKKMLLHRQIDFDFGAIGFRNSGNERAFVKNVYVQRLR